MAEKTFGLGRIALGGLARKFGTLCGVSLALACVLVVAGCARSVYDLGLSKCEKLLTQMEKGAKAREKTGNAGSYFEIAEGAFEDFYATFQTLVEQVVTLGKEPSNKQKERFRAICKRAVGLGYDEFAQVEMLFWSSEEIAQAERAMRESGGISTQASDNGGQTMGRIAGKDEDFIYDLNEDSTGVVIKGLNGDFPTVQIPEKIEGFPVVEIESSAFTRNINIKSVSIPSGITSIKERTFERCIELTRVIIPSSVTSIGELAFYDCSKLTSITIPSNHISIGRGAFEGCTSLTSFSIPDGITSIGDSWFSGCSGLTSITIPNSVTSIGGSAFEGCTGLTSITIPGSIVSIGAGAFSGCTGLTSVTIPDSVTSIERHAFSYCTGLTSVTIPDNVTSIEGYAFKDCTGLTSVTIPDSVTSIGGRAFEGCTGLTSITIPDSVTFIGFAAFRNCTRLTSVVISDRASIDFDNSYEPCFESCSNLSLVSKSALKKAGYTGSF